MLTNFSFLHPQGQPLLIIPKLIFTPQTNMSSVKKALKLAKSAIDLGDAELAHEHIQDALRLSLIHI